MKSIIFLFAIFSLARGSQAKKQTQNLADLDYRVYPLRTEEEAAVLEWGHSAIISALDASVALFGPQTTQAALLEVECMPILASPLNGVGDRSPEDPESDQLPVRALDNADDVHGNMVVMTNNGGLSGLEMARVAKLSGAAALLLVNIDEKRPDDIYRLALLDGETAEDIDIPVVMVSLNSANVLTTATVTSEMQAHEIVNHGMPDRVRLYAGGDRPFFEDVEPTSPTLYLIHNLLTKEEAETMIQVAENKVSLVEKEDLLQMTPQTDTFPFVKRVMLWQGMLQSTGQKAMEERIEQVTGFPVAHYSDWVVDKIEPGAHWKPHYDDHPLFTAMATITVFLTEEGGPIVYPSSRSPVKVVPRRGMAIVHHNTDEQHKMDLSTVHALMPHDGDKPVYIARKYIFTEPVSNARRIALPVFALPFGGKLPGPICAFHDFLLEQFGVEQGSFYFDKACVFIPLLILLLIVQAIAEYVQRQFKKTAEDKKKKAEKESSGKTRKGKKD
jgi:hypothetical protein